MKLTAFSPLKNRGPLWFQEHSGIGVETTICRGEVLVLGSVDFSGFKCVNCIKGKIHTIGGPEIWFSDCHQYYYLVYV